MARSRPGMIEEGLRVGPTGTREGDGELDRRHAGEVASPDGRRPSLDGAERTPRVATRSPIPVAAIALCAVVAVVVRLPFLRAGLVPDEGGYASIARQWSRGAPLYDEAWLDRPQGLLVVYRLLLGIASEPWAVRLGAVICGAGITVLLGVVGWHLRGPATGVVAAALYAVAGLGPRLNGYTLNGELAAALPATGALAAALVWRSTKRVRWLVVSGLAAGSALLMKQSAVDGAVVAVVVVLLANESWARRRRAAAVLAGSTAVPLSVSMIHGWVIGWDRYWYAVVGYRFDAPSGRFDVLGLLDRAGRFLGNADVATRELGVLAALALVALVLGVPRREPVAIPAVWLGTAVVGFHLGGLYWRHYYVQLIPPLVLLAALAVTAMASRFRQSLAIVLALAPVAVYFVDLASAEPERRGRLIAHQRAFEDHERIAEQLHELADPEDAIYVLVSEPDLYFVVDLPSRYPYLWGNLVHSIPGALDRLRSLLASADRPEWLAVYTPPDDVDPSGRLGTVLGREYVDEPRVESRQARILRARED